MSSICTEGEDSRAIPRAVFLHTGWRTAGTWLWSRFRALPTVEAYCEPLNEQLHDLTEEQLASLVPDTWASNHPPLARPYYHEFTPLLQPGGGVRGFHASFAADDFFAAEQPPALQTYLASLIGHAAANSRHAVMKFCRSIGRIGWMHNAFPDVAHVTMLRNPATQFESARRQMLGHKSIYFLTMPLVILARNMQDPDVAEALALFDVHLPALPSTSSLGEVAAACLSYLLSTTPEQWYRGFVALWALAVSSIPQRVDLYIDSDLLTMSPSYRSETEAKLRALTGLPVDLGTAEYRTRIDCGIGVPTSVARHCHQAAAALLAVRNGPGWAGSAVGRRVTAMLANADRLVDTRTVRTS
jgi:hypothetical protein